MSVWDEPSSMPLPNRQKQIQTNTQALCYLYPLKTIASSNTNRISPKTESRKGVTDAVSNQNISKPPPFTDPTIVCSEAWSSSDILKTNKNRSWIRFQTKFTACIRSIKCRFMTLGILLGLLMSLSVIIPIVILWQSSSSKSTTINSLSTSTIASSSSSSLIAYGEIGTCNNYFCENQMIFISNMTISTLSITITVQRTGNTTYNNAYSTYSPTINSTYSSTSSQITYQFFIQTGQLPAGNYTCVAQYDLVNINHTTSADTYSISTTNICGVTSSITGNFP